MHQSEGGAQADLVPLMVDGRTARRLLGGIDEDRLRGLGRTGEIAVVRIPAGDGSLGARSG